MEEETYAVASDSSQRLQGDGGYRDAPFALAFLVHLLLVVFFGFTEGVPVLHSAGDAGGGGGGGSEQAQYLGGLLLVCVISPIVCCVFAFTYVGYIKNNAESMVECLVTSHIFITLAAVTFCVSSGASTPAALFLLFAAIEVCWYLSIRHRIPFMAAHLACACEAVQTYPEMVWYSVGMIVPQVLWVISWCLCVITVYARATAKSCAYYGMIDDPADSTRCCEPAANQTLTQEDCEAKDASNAVYFALLISLYWGAQVVANVVHTTCCGATGAWWFQSYDSNAVNSSFRRAMTTSFGSICLGSLVVAALKTVEYLLRETKDNACLACVLSCVRSLIEYFNRFAYVYVALYGFDFRRAGSAVFGLFRSSGWTVVIHDDLLGIVLLFGALACGVVGAVIGVGVGSAFEDDSLSTAVIYALVGLLTGLFAAQQVFCVLDSAFATVLVAWAEEPAALRASNPSLYLRLYEAWNTHQHDLFETAKSRYPEKYAIPNGV